MTTKTKTPDAPAVGVDFSTLPWNMNLPDGSDSYYIHLTTTSSEWTNAEHLDKMEECVYSFKDRMLPLTPATTSLNYGTTIWEGIRAHRTADDKAVVFRPDRNYERMKKGAYDMGLPMPSKEIFMRAIQLAVQKNSHNLPPPGDGVKLYLRPMLMGTGQQLGLYPSPEISFLIYVSPTGNYFAAAKT
jgi:branched-chain amino acid aminotransferase